MSSAASADVRPRRRAFGLDRLQDANRRQVDAITRVAAQLCDTPLAYVSYNDASRERFVSCFGFSLNHVAAHAGLAEYIISGHAELLLSDTRNAPAFARAPLLQSGIAPRFFAGVPILDGNNECLGVLAVMDRVVRHLPREKLDGLAALADQVAFLCEPGTSPNSANSIDRRLLENMLTAMPGRHGLYHADGLRVAATSRLVAQTLDPEGGAIIGKPLRELLEAREEESVDSIMESMQRVVDTGEPNRVVGLRYSVPRPVERGGGFEERYWNIINAPVLDENDKVAFVLRSAEDVTELALLREREGEASRDNEKLEERARRMEADVLTQAREVERLNEHLRNAQRMANVGSFELPESGGRCFFSNEVLAILDIDIAPPGEDILLAAMTEDEQARLRDLRQAAFDGQPLDVTHRIVRPDGSIRHVRQQARAMEDFADGKRRLIGTLQDITQQVHLENELRVRAKQQEAVSRLGQALLAGATREEVQQQAIEQVTRLLDVELCKVLELLPGGNAMKLAAGQGFKPGVVGNVTLPTDRQSQAGFTLLSNSPVIVHDLRAETRFESSQLLRDHGVVSGISVVIPGSDGPWGVLGAHTSRLREFTQDDLNFFSSVALVIAGAVRRDRLRRENREQQARQSALLRLSALALEGARVERILELAATLITEVLEVEISSVSRRLPDTGHVEVVSGVGWKEGVVNHAVIGNARNSMSGYVIEMGAPIVSVDIAAETRFRPSPLLAEHGVTSALCVPVLQQDHVWGTIAACSHKERHFSRNDVAFLVAMAEMLASLLRQRK